MDINAQATTTTTGQAGSGVCPDCEYPLFDHLSADEAEAHGIDPGLRDGRGCAVVARAGTSLQPRESALAAEADYRG